MSFRTIYSWLCHSIDMRTDIKPIHIIQPLAPVLYRNQQWELMSGKGACSYRLRASTIQIQKINSSSVTTTPHKRTSTYVFCDSKVRSYAQAAAVAVWPSDGERMRAKVICLENVRCWDPPSLTNRKRKRIH